jgi:hypothetical protein
VVLTAAMIRDAARKRDEHLKTILRDEQRKGKSEAQDLLKAEETLLAERQALRLRIAAGIPEIPRPPSHFHAYLQEFKALCDQHGAELVVVALPIDVQVSAEEWAKYGVTDAPDMQDSLVLLDDLIADASALGLRALDATAALRAAEPGAFLDHDIHMTAKGHAALADALAATLVAPIVRPLRRPGPGLPEGRSFVPTDAEWRAAGEVTVKGSTAAGCKTQIVREWLRVQCRRQKTERQPRRARAARGPEPGDDDHADQRRPQPGHADDDRRADHRRPPLEEQGPRARDPLARRRRGQAQIRRHPHRPRGQDLAPGATTRPGGRGPLPLPRIERSGENFCANTGDEDEYVDCRSGCSLMWGDPRLAAACTAAFPGCDARLACVQNDPIFAPACPEGQVHAFASNACFTACDAAHPCAAGKCEDWQGGGVCV